MAAQQRFDEAFAKNAWSGWAQVHFLDGRVCIASDIDDDGIKTLSPILEDIYWLTHLELFGTWISDDQLANLQQRLPNVHIDRRWGRNLIDELAISSDPTDDVGDRRARAFAAVEELSALGKQAFPYLLEHLDDNRESVELQRLNRRQDVGEACYCIIAYQILDIPPGYAIPMVRTGADGELHHRPFSAEQGLFDSSTITAWLKQREAEPLAALQVEALEWLLEQENKIGYPDSKSKATFHDPLVRHLESIKAGL